MFSGCWLSKYILGIRSSKAIINQNHLHFLWIYWYNILEWILCCCSDDSRWWSFLSLINSLASLNCFIRMSGRSYIYFCLPLFPRFSWYWSSFTWLSWFSNWAVVFRLVLSSLLFSNIWSLWMYNSVVKCKWIMLRWLLNWCFFWLCLIISHWNGSKFREITNFKLRNLLKPHTFTSVVIKWVIRVRLI